MIVGLGMDLVETDRIRQVLERFGERFVTKILHESERTAMAADSRRPTSQEVDRIAARFAAKEAGVKALGTGFSNGIWFQDIRILSLPSGKPEIHFHGKALERAVALKVLHAHVSLTHARDTAGAVVILEAGV